MESDVDPFATAEPLTDVVDAATATGTICTDDSAVVRLYSVTAGSNDGESVSPLTDIAARVASDLLNARTAKIFLASYLGVSLIAQLRLESYEFQRSPHDCDDVPTSPKLSEYEAVSMSCASWSEGRNQSSCPLVLSNASGSVAANPRVGADATIAAVFFAPEPRTVKVPETLARVELQLRLLATQSEPATSK
jgi:hypothetical protein